MERARGESRRLSGKGNMILMILEVIGTEILQPKYLLLLVYKREEEGRRERLRDEFRFSVYRTQYLIFF